MNLIFNVLQLKLLSHFYSPVASFKKLNYHTEGVKFHRASLWKENDSFVKQFTARTAADLKQLGRSFWKETLPWAVFPPFEGQCSFHFNQGKVCKNMERSKVFFFFYTKTQRNYAKWTQLLSSVLECGTVFKN